MHRKLSDSLCISHMCDVSCVVVTHALVTCVSTTHALAACSPTTCAIKGFYILWHATTM